MLNKNRLLNFLFFIFITNISFSQQTVGNFLNTPESFNGYTLFGNNEITYLIDNCGFKVNEWESDYDPGLAMYLLENGNLLRTAKVNGSFNAGGLGGRFELFDWEGNLLWNWEYKSSDFHAHHDIAPLQNGNFLAIAWEKHSSSEAQSLGRISSGEVWSEKIIEVEMIGTNQANIVWEWQLWNHLIQNTDASKPNFGNIAEHPELIDINYIDETEENEKDWIHLNSIDFNESLDQIVISSRNFSEIWIIDHSTTTAQAASHSGGNSGKGGDILYRFGNPQTYKRGTVSDHKFFKQHDANWIKEGAPNAGKLMVFNNQNLPNSSSIEIWSPPLNGFNYEISASEPFPPNSVDFEFSEAGFYSEIMSSAAVLPNGNILICEGKEGHIFEINEELETVWEYINPVNKNGFPAIQGGTPQFNDLFRCTRYSPDFEGFIGKDLTPTVQVETLPWNLDCEIYENEVAVFEIDFESKIKILGNPFSEKLVVQSDFENEILEGRVFDVLGNVLKKVEILAGVNVIEFSGLESGVYFLEIEENLQIFKIINL